MVAPSPKAAPIIEPPPARPDLIDAGLTYGSLTDHIVDIPLRRGFHRLWLGGLGISLCFVMLLMLAITLTIVRGVGIWGINIPVAWAFAITNFVWWIGIGHAGTLISAILLLCRQPWRNSISRFAEAMTIFAVANAGLFPLLHLGRIWKFYYLLPYPNTMGAWPQWRSPLVWDVFAVATYFTVSLLFWYMGLVPDLATLRDSSRRRWVRVTAGIFALGWRGSARHWLRYQAAYLLFAGLATPLVVSVHSIVSMDFATAVVPAWHTTIFPPYFVAGAIFSGFAMVLTLAIPLRAAFKLHDVITPGHLNSMAKVMLATGLIVAYGYLMETFTSYYSGDTADVQLTRFRLAGGAAPVFWMLIFCNVISAQALWFKWVRTNPVPLLVVSFLINVGMWLERFDIIAQGLERDFLPSKFGFYRPTVWDWSLLLGTLGLFAALFFVFVRLVPMVSIFELRELLHSTAGHGPGRRPDTESEDRVLEPVEPELEYAGAAPPPVAVPASATVAQLQAQPVARPRIAPPQAPPRPERLYGLMAEFATPEQVVAAAQAATAEGYTATDAFTPIPVEGLPEALGFTKTRVSMIVLAGAIVGAVGIYLLQYYSAVIDYPWNIGGRPLHSWPSFIPLTFELGVLGGSLFGFFGMWGLNRLPQLYHPVFNAPGFERASRDRFFLCIQAADPAFDHDRTREFLLAQVPLRVSDVPEEPE